ncbi:predicted protein [Plenodomus lingam JN3]|uniref:Predicted protein n=1 Tax=Leptosphaeria maculans (strain JN3 / isolate v23.1.3 / race Av1-4-5-6-7-8) TaxID=985895 RepID=E4ZK70_LEPMJ|nr:predicted protein [Plenodomus lingam JN3]CBX91665.1 predicted protein [Plenodomus lingam JN3]
MSSSTPIKLTSSRYGPSSKLSPKIQVTSYHMSVQERVKGIKAVVTSDQSTSKMIGEHPMNILTLKSEERQLLLEGPSISIIADGNIIIRKAVPLRALKASCTKVHDLFQVKPRATQFRVYGKINQESVERLLDILSTENLVDVKDIKLELPSMGFVEGVLMYQACLCLGVIYHHTKPLIDVLCAQVTDRLLTTEEMSTIVNRCPPQDPLFRHLANSLCHRRFKKQIPDVVAFEHWLGKKPALQKAMSEIDQAHKKRRAAIKKRNCSWRSDSVLAKWGEDQM